MMARGGGKGFARMAGMMGMGGPGGMDALQALGGKMLGPEAAEALKAAPPNSILPGLGGPAKPTLPPGLGGSPFNPFRKP